MVVDAPQYIKDAFMEECKILDVPPDFVEYLFTYPAEREFGSRGGFCKPILLNGKKRVVIGIREERNRRGTLGNLRHDMKHAQQFFTGDCSNFMYDELAAYTYEVRRRIGDAFYQFCKKLKLKK